MNEEYPFSSEELLEYRKLTDPKAEQIVELLFDHYNMQHIGELFRKITEHTENHNFPEFLKEYLEDIGNLPEWLDMEQLRRGQALFLDYGREIVLSLLTRSLPSCYVCGNGAQVLTTTTRLIDLPKNPKYTRRILETFQFVINVCTDQDFGNPLGLAQTSIKRVRLIHATIRKYIHDHEEWPANEFGEPINQEDLCITLNSFCLQVILGLDTIGIHLSKQEREDWSHLWKVVGFLLGIEEKLLPQSYLQFEQMAARIYETQARRSDSGVILTYSCIEFMSSVLPNNWLTNFSVSVFKYMNAEEFRSDLDLNKKHAFYDWLMPKLMKDTLAVDQRVEDRSWFLKWVINRINSWLFKTLSNTIMKNDHNFYLPPNLTN